MYRKYMYVSSEEFLFCLQQERFFSPYNAVISSASPPCRYFTWFLGPISPSGLQHIPFLPGLLPFLLCLLLFYSSIFQFQTLAPLHQHLSFISLLPRGAVATAGIKAFQPHLLSQKKNKPLGVFVQAGDEEKK